MTILYFFLRPDTLTDSLESTCLSAKVARILPVKKCSLRWDCVGKRRELDAFLYDGVVLDYLVSQDEECRLLTVGSWYAMSGYGAALPRGSKYLPAINEKLLEYIENGGSSLFFFKTRRPYWSQLLVTARFR